MHKKKNQNKIPKAFIIALFFALLFWSLIKLSKEYKSVITFPVTYAKIPQNKLIQETPLTHIDIQIKASGFKLAGLSLIGKTIALDASKLQRKSNSEYFFLLKNQTLDIQQQISNTYAIDYIVQDTMYLNLGLLTTKKIPVVGDFDISYKLGYHLTNSIKITPDSVLVSGPEKQMQALQFLRLQKLTLADVATSIETVLPIISNDEALKFSIKEAVVKGEVDRFTEGSIEMPIEVINLPDSISINTFPKTLKAVYQVGLSNFNKVNASSFKIVCDYQHTLSNNLKYLIPRVISKPAFVTSVRLVPNKVEFLIQK